MPRKHAYKKQKQRATFGYKPSPCGTKLIQDEHEQRVIAIIRDMAEAGKFIRDVANVLNDQLKIRPRIGLHWTDSNIRHVARSNGISFADQRRHGKGGHGLDNESKEYQEEIEARKALLCPGWQREKDEAGEGASAHYTIPQVKVMI